MHIYKQETYIQNTYTHYRGKIRENISNFKWQPLHTNTINNND